MEAAVDGPVRLVWQNEAGGLTGRTVAGPPRFVKWNPPGSGESLADESERLRWLAGRHPVPRLVSYHHDRDGEILVTEAVEARSAVDDHWRAEPKTAIGAIATGLRRLHALDVADCPFDWGVAQRLATAVAAGVPIADDLGEAPPIDHLVICHGDPCSPNTLIDDHGRFAGTVDVGRVGKADRWADLAVATMALSWNYADYDEQWFWDSYGIAPDATRIGYYRRLWNST